MKKSILNIGKVLNKQEQKEVAGGFGGVFFRYCRAVTSSECNRSPQCQWSAGVCINTNPHIV